MKWNYVNCKKEDVPPELLVEYRGWFYVLSEFAFLFGLNLNPSGNRTVHSNRVHQVTIFKPTGECFWFQDVFSGDFEDEGREEAEAFARALILGQIEFNDSLEAAKGGESKHCPDCGSQNCLADYRGFWICYNCGNFWEPT